MTQKLLHLADIGSARQQMGGERVAEGVRAYLLVDARTQGRLLYDGEYHHTRKARSTIIQKQSILALRLGLAQLLVLQHSLTGDAADRHKTLLVTLANHIYVALSVVYIVELQVAKFRYAQSARVEQFDDSPVTQTFGGGGVNRIYYAINLLG